MLDSVTWNSSDQWSEIDGRANQSAPALSYTSQSIKRVWSIRQWASRPGRDGPLIRQSRVKESLLLDVGTEGPDHCDYLTVFPSSIVADGFCVFYFMFGCFLPLMGQGSSEWPKARTGWPYGIEVIAIAICTTAPPAVGSVVIITTHPR